MEARINARAASLQCPRPYSVYVSGSNSSQMRLSPKTRDPLVAGKNGRLMSSYSRSPSRSPTNTLRDKTRKTKSFDAASTTNDGKQEVAGAGNGIDGDVNDNTRPPRRKSSEPGYRRAAMMPVTSSTSTWKIVKNSRCLVSPDPLFGVHINKEGEMYTTSDTLKGGLLQCFDRNGNCLKSFHLKPYKNGKPFEPFQVHETPEGHLAIACNTSVTVWTKEGKLVIEHGKNMFKFCKNVAVRSTGEIIATDSDGDCVKIISPGGQQITKLDYKIFCAAGVAVDSNDNIIVTNWSHKVWVFDSENRFVRCFGQKGHDDGELDMAYGVCTDEDNNIIVADMWNDRVSVFSIEGRFIGHVATSTSAGVHRPLHLAITRGTDADDNRLAVIEFGGSLEVKLLSY